MYGDRLDQGEIPRAAPEDHHRNAPLLEVRGLSIWFRSRRGRVPAVRDVSFQLGHRETLGMVGESGSGKSVTALAMLGLLGEHAEAEGTILFEGRDLLSLDRRLLRGYRGREIAMIFQEPMRALDPVFTVGFQMVETLRAHEPVSRKAARRRALDLLEEVGMPDPARRFQEYPTQLSGGMQQRVMIAMALICRPKLLIADEPTTALDVTIQAQILSLLRHLNQEHGTALLLVSHDVGVVAEACDKVVTLYAGEVVERAPLDDLLESPLHPYTSGLLRAVPRVDRREGRLEAIPGRVPAGDEMPAGCRFHPRCQHATGRCVTEKQDLRTLGADRSVRCHRADELPLAGVVT